MKKNIGNNFAFAIIEILLGMFIFSLGLISVYAIIISTLKLNDYNSNYIVATSLAKEQIELVKNIRDTNYKLLKPYNLKNPNGNSLNNDDKFQNGHYYIIENKFGNNFSIILNDITVGFEEGQDKLNQMENYRLCIDTNNIYTYDCSGDNIKTNFYRYFYVEELKDNSKTYQNVFKIVSKVIWYKRGYHDFFINTVVADWKRL